MEMSSAIKNGGFDSDKFSLPVSLKQPGPKDETIKCLIKRDKSNMTFHLYLSLNPATLESGKFLLSAKRKLRITYIEYVISMDANKISRSSSTYIGKIRSNFLGTKFEIYDNKSCHISSPPNRSSRFFKSKKISPNLPSGRSNNIGQVTYDLNVLGTRGPRKMHCIMEEGPLVLRNKPPKWHTQLKCWCLNFKGRVIVASVKNFQLLEAEKPGESSDQEKIILQFGRVDKDLFTMDYTYPLSAFQAFAICLTSFDTKLACE